MRTIPKNIHFLWYQGWKEFPTKYESNIASVIDNNPGYKIFKWDNESIRQILKNIGQQYLDKYDSFEIMHQRIDMGRYAVLYWFGGISVDCDAKSFNGFDNTPHINTSDFIASYNSSNEIENLVKANIPEVLINATILVKPRHPILKNLLDNILASSCSIQESKYSCIQNTTGPRAFTKYLLDNYKDQITILDNEYFDPCNGNDTECKIPDSAILDQQQEGSWANPAYKTVAQSWYFVKRHWGVIAIIIIVIILISCSKK